MSDTKFTKSQLQEAEYRKQLSTITTKVLDSFLRDRSVTNACPMCGHSEMVVPQVQFVHQEKGIDVMGRHAHYASYIGTTEEFDPVNFCYHVICKNCGYTMQYNTAVVLNWHLKKGRGNE